MTIPRVDPKACVAAQEMSYLTKTTRELRPSAPMQSRPTLQLQPATTQNTGPSACEAELDILRDVLRMLPSGITIQDEQGEFLRVNDAAAVQLGAASGQPGRA